MSLRNRIGRLEGRDSHNPVVLIVRAPDIVPTDPIELERFLKVKRQANGLPTERPVIVIYPDEAEV